MQALHMEACSFSLIFMCVWVGAWVCVQIKQSLSEGALKVFARTKWQRGWFHGTLLSPWDLLKSCFLPSSPLPLFFFLLCCFFLHIIFRLVSFRTRGTPPPCAVPGGHGSTLSLHTQTAATSPPGPYPVCSSSAECTGLTAISDSTTTSAVLRKTQTAISAAAAAH